MELLCAVTKTFQSPAVLPFILPRILLATDTMSSVKAFLNGMSDTCDFELMHGIPTQAEDGTDSPNKVLVTNIAAGLM